MTERATHTTVHFRHPFRIEGIEGEHPSGSYVVETIEEEIGGLSFLAYRRVSTTIVLRSGQSSRQVVTIEPQELEAAQARDRCRP